MIKKYDFRKLTVCFLTIGIMLFSRHSYSQSLTLDDFIQFMNNDLIESKNELIKKGWVKPKLIFLDEPRDCRLVFIFPSEENEYEVPCVYIDSCLITNKNCHYHFKDSMVYIEFLNSISKYKMKKVFSYFKDGYKEESYIGNRYFVNFIVVKSESVKTTIYNIAIGKRGTISPNIHIDGDYSALTNYDDYKFFDIDSLIRKKKNKIIEDSILIANKSIEDSILIVNKSVDQCMQCETVCYQEAESSIEVKVKPDIISKTLFVLSKGDIMCFVEKTTKDYFKICNNGQTGYVYWTNASAKTLSKFKK